MKRVALRVDASRQVGTGHLRRSLALAHALREAGGEVRFVTRDLGLSSGAFIGEHGFAETCLLPPPDGPVERDPTIPHGAWAQVRQEQDASETVAALGEFAPDWVVIDSYAFDARWHDAVREGLGCHIAQIDDVPDRNLAPDLLIDHTDASDHRAKYADCLTRKARILGGPRFALLGPAFAEAPRYEFSEEVRSIGVFMGGVDAGNHTAMVLDALDAAGFAGALEVVSTSANPNLAALSERVATRAQTTLSLDLPDLAGFFAAHDLQIGSGGGASWERCCIGVPTLLVIIAENQREVAPRLAEQGIVALASQADPQAIASELRALLADAPRRQMLSEASRRLVDGKGAARVALAMLAPAMQLRAATRDDADLMFEWRNHEANRSVSGETAALDPASHADWLVSVLADDARRLFVGSIGSRAVGIIRFDHSECDRAEVSLYLDPDLHGLGLGPHLLLAGEAACHARTIDATVLERNLASQRLFANCGYEQRAPEHWVKHLK